MWHHFTDANYFSEIALMGRESVMFAITSQGQSATVAIVLSSTSPEGRGLGKREELSVIAQLLLFPARPM